MTAVSVRSVDMQTVVARAHEAERVQRLAQQVPSVAQEEFASRLASEAGRKASRVETGRRPEELAVRDRREGGRGRSGGDHAAGEGADDRHARGRGESPHTERTDLGSRIDVKV